MMLSLRKSSIEGKAKDIHLKSIKTSLPSTRTIQAERQKRNRNVINTKKPSLWQGNFIQWTQVQNKALRDVKLSLIY